MLLHTPLYLAFLIVVSSLYWWLRHPRWRKVFLLVASYVLYALFDVRFAVLLIGLTLVAYVLGRAIPGQPRGRCYAWLSIVVNLGFLLIFKCAGFFLDVLPVDLQQLGILNLPSSLRLLLPIGLSFYAFQAIAYTTEIYQERIEPASLLDVSLYLAFFPKLLAGPFVRPSEFLRQLAKTTIRPNRSQWITILNLLMLGLFKKVVLADSLGSLADVAFRAAGYPVNAGIFPAPLYWQGFYLYAFQIYTDFSGYTDLARASAMLLGFSLPENFRQPYLAVSPGDFWNRWHITLTHWFREYLFFPLSRFLLTATKRRYARAIQVGVTLTTMILIGLWHGIAWNYVAWGTWHGLLLAIDRWINFKPTRRWQKLAMAMLNFHLIGVGWILFRTTSWTQAWHFLVGLVSLDQWVWLGYYGPAVGLVGILVFGIDLSSRLGLSASPRWKSWQPVLVVAVFTLTVTLWLIQAASGTPQKPFIYASF